MPFWSRIVLLLSLAFVQPASLAAQSATDVARVYSIGVLQDNFPYAYVPADERDPVGFAVDLLNQIVEVSDLRVRYVFGTTQAIHAQFKRGEIDALLAFAYSDERAQSFSFSRPYLRMAQRVFVRPEHADWTNFKQLRGRKVFVHRGSLGERVLREHGLADSIVYTDSVNAALHAVAEGRADATLSALLTGASVADRDRLDLIPNRIVVPDSEVDYCFATQKSETELVNRINEALAVIHLTGAYEPIYEKWFGRLEPRRFSTVQVLIAVCGGLLVALLVAVFAAIHQRRLRRQLVATNEALAVTEQHFRDVFDASPVGLIVADVEGTDRSLHLRLRDANPTAAKLFRWSPPPLGLDLLDSSPRCTPLWQAVAAVRSHTSPTPTDLQLNRDDAGPLHLRWSAVRDEKRVLLVVNDITKQVQATEELRIAERNLLQSQKLDALGNLSSGIAHDFNNVLASILGNVELLLLETPPDSPTHELADNILRGSRRARDLVRQILAFSRQSPPERKPIDLREIINETIQLARAAVPRAIALPVHLPDQPCIVMADGTQIHQVLLNLVTNAAQAIGDQPGQISIDLTPRTVRARLNTQSPFGLEPDIYHCIQVTDNGPGMPPEVVARAMEPFFTTKQKNRGTGLGLSVAHGVATQHGGILRLESEPGQGTQVEVWLPASPAEESAPRLDLIDLTPVASDHPIVMVVDDEEVAARTMSRMLTRIGCEPETFQNPLEAIAAFRADPQRYRAVLCDLAMPECSGLKVLGTFREIRPELPTLLMTGFWSNGSRDKALDLGIDILTEKPISLAELHQHLLQLLSRSQP